MKLAALSFGTTRKVLTAVKNSGTIVRSEKDIPLVEKAFSGTSEQPLMHRIISRVARRKGDSGAAMASYNQDRDFIYMLPKGTTGATLLHEYGHAMQTAKKNPLHADRTLGTTIKGELRQEQEANKMGLSVIKKVSKDPERDRGEFLKAMIPAYKSYGAGFVLEGVKSGVRASSVQPKQKRDLYEAVAALSLNDPSKGYSVLKQFSKHKKVDPKLRRQLNKQFKAFEQSSLGSPVGIEKIAGDFSYKNYKYTVPIATGLAALGFAFANRDDIKPHIDYAKYLIPHKWHVGTAMRDADLGWGQTLKHDLSKFTPSEWPQYVAYFNGPTGIKGTNDKETYLEWRKAVQHHYANNEHHWRALHKEPKEVPMEYRLEAVADWYGVNRAKGKTKASFKNWYQDKETFLPIDNATKEEMRKRLGMGPMSKVGFSMSAERNFAHSAVRAIERHEMSLPKEVWQKLNLVINEGGGKYIRQATEPKTHIYEVMHENKPLRVIYHDEDKVIKTVLPQVGAPAKIVGKIDLSKTGAVMKKKPPVPSVNAPHVPMTQVVASLDPMIQAIAKNMDPAKQKTMWKRYAEIVLEKRNYGRRGRVADEYIKTKVHKD